MLIKRTWGNLLGVAAIGVALAGAGCGGEDGGGAADASAGRGGSGGSGGTGGRGGSGGSTDGGGSGGAAAGSGGSGGAGGAGGAAGMSGGVDAPAPDAGEVDASTDTRPEPPASAIPAPWKGEDIGDVGIPGTSGRNRTTFQVKASGGDIWAEDDGFHFLHRPVTGDLEMVARVASLERPNGDAKAGLMFRETTAADSRNVSMLVLPGNVSANGTVTPGKGSRMQFRDKRVDNLTGFADLVSVQPGMADAPPVWLRLTRRGGLFEGFISGDGSTWLKDGEVNLSMLGPDLLAGLAVTAHTNNDTAHTTFEHVRLTALTDATWGHAELGTLGGYAAGAPRRFDLSNSGRGIANSEDGISFVYRRTPHIGDVEVTARVTELRYAEDRPARIGVMLRGMLRGDARMIGFVVELGPNGQRYRMQRRAQDGGNISSTDDMTLPPGPDGGAPVDAATVDASGDGGAPVVALEPVWIKLVRVGQRFVGFVSTNGRNWRAAIDLPSFVIASNAFVGVALTSGTEGATASGRVENVTIAEPTTDLPVRPDAAAPEAGAMP